MREIFKKLHLVGEGHGLVSRYKRETPDTQNEVDDFAKLSEEDAVLDRIGRMDLLVGYRGVDGFLRNRFGDEFVDNEVEEQRKKNREADKRFREWERNNARVVSGWNKIID